MKDKNQQLNKKNPKKSKKSIFLIERIKAFIADIFMVYTPILYISYIALGSKEAFQQNQFVIFVCFLMYALIASFLFGIKGQTFGYMYAEIKLIRNDGKRVGFLLAFFRFLLFCFSMSLLFGFIFPLLNKNRKTFHDLIAKTDVMQYLREVK